MKFGKSWEDAQNEPQGQSNNGYMKYFKDGDTTFRILQEPKDWTSYWEHYQPGGYPFPCTNERSTCPGCTSDNEKMKKASRKIAFNVLEGEFVNVYKCPKTVADKLDNRAQRHGTVMDRDYTISRFSSKNADGSTRTDYDIESHEKRPVDVTKLELKDVEEMLSEAYDQSWGDSSKVQASKDNAEFDKRASTLQEKIAAAKAENETPPWEQQDPGNTYDEADLRKMSEDEVLAVCQKEGKGDPPRSAKTVDQIVDWLLEQQ